MSHPTPASVYPRQNAAQQASAFAAARSKPELRLALDEDQRMQFITISTSDLPPNQKAIMYQVARFARGGNRCYVRLGKLAHYAGITRRAARMALHGDPRSKNPQRRRGLAAVDELRQPTLHALLEMEHEANQPDEWRTRKYVVRWDHLHRATPPPGEAKQPTRVRSISDQRPAEA